MKTPTQLFRQKALAALVKYDRSRRYLVGVSGGVDSCVLLCLLLESGLTDLVVCHLNHELRGKESAEDAHFVHQLAVDHRLPSMIRAVRVNPTEAMARKARLKLFREAAAAFETSEIFLGHHANDQVETILFNLLRGTSSIGRAGMRETDHLDSFRPPLQLHRPFLAFWKKEIESFASEMRIPFRTDSSNATPDFTRNQIRNQLLPLIEQTLGRSVKTSLHRLGTIAADEADLLDSLTPELWRTPALEVSAIRALPVAIQRRVIYQWLEHRCVADIGFQEVEAIRGLVHEVAPAKVNLPGRSYCRRRNQKLFLEQSEAAAKQQTS